MNLTHSQIVILLWLSVAGALTRDALFRLLNYGCSPSEMVGEDEFGPMLQCLLRDRCIDAKSYDSLRITYKGRETLFNMRIATPGARPAPDSR